MKTIKLIVLFLFFNISASAFAFPPNVQSYKGEYGGKWFYGDNASVCSQIRDAVKENSGARSVDQAGCYSTYVRIHIYTSTGSIDDYVNITISADKLDCPSGANLINGNCTCGDSYSESNGQCVPKNCSVPGTSWSNEAKACLCSDGLEPAGNSCNACPSNSPMSFQFTGNANGVNPPESYCDGACSYSASGIGVKSQNSSGVWMGYQDYRSTGVKCGTQTPSYQPGSTPPPDNPASNPTGGASGPSGGASDPSAGSTGGTSGSTSGGTSGNNGTSPGVTNPTDPGGINGGPRGPASGSNSGSSPSNGSSSGSGTGTGDGKITCKDINTCQDGNAGAGLPGRPKLYTPKYQNGPAGVWNSKSSQLKQSPIFTLGAQLLPTVNSGAPPSWTFNFDFGRGWNFGSYTLSPESYVWTALRGLVICLACIMAFRLVFGG